MAGKLNVNTSTNTIEAGTSGGIKLDPGATDVVEIGNGVLLPDGTKTLPALRFSDDANTGVYSPLNDVISLTGHGEDILRLIGTSSSANYLKVTSSVSGNPVIIEPDGSDADVSLNVLPKGSGNVTISGLNYPNSDGANGEVLTTDGSGNLTFSAASLGGSSKNLEDTNLIVEGTDVASAVNYATVTNSVAGDPVKISADGNDTDIDVELNPKGGGVVKLGTIELPNDGGGFENFLVTNGGGTLSWTNTLTRYSIRRSQLNSVSGSAFFGTGTNNAYKIKITGDVTSISLSVNNFNTYEQLVIEIEQDSIGGHTLTGWPSSVTWPGGTEPSLSSAPGSIDIITLQTFDGGSNWRGNFSKDYK